jgi:hypothetical protein
MKRSRFSASLLLAALLLSFPARGGNLPQTKSAVVITGKQHQALRAYARLLGDTPEEFTAPIEKILLTALPKAYRTGCAQMVATWGEHTRRTETLMPRPLYFRMMADSTRLLMLAYTCFSSAPTYGDRYYDERLAALTIGKSSSTLAMLPLARECATCSELSHLGLQDDSLRIGGAPAITIASGVSNDNPCCGVTTSVDEKRLHYYLLDSRGVTPVAEMLEYRKETSRSAAGGDSTTIYSVKRFL